MTSLKSGRMSRDHANGSMFEMTAINEQIRRETAKILAIEVENVPEEINLIEIGLHSLALLRLIEPLSKLAGSRIDYADLAARPTVRDWSVLVASRSQTLKKEIDPALGHA